MRRILKNFKNLSFRKKVTIICLFVGLIPVIVLGSFSYGQVRKLLIDREKTALKESLKQEVYNLNYKIDSYLNAINLILWDEDVRSSLTHTFTDNFDMYKTYMYELDPLFTTVRTLHGEIKTLTIYTDNPIYPHGSTLRPLTDIDRMPWYREALSKTTPFFVASKDKKSLFLVCQLYLSGSNYKSILYMNISYDKTFGTLSTLFNKSYGVILENGQGEVLYSSHNFKEKEAPLSSLKDGELNAAYVTQSAALKNFGWKIYVYRPVRTVSQAANQITVIVILIIFLCLLLLFALSSLLSKNLVRPLEELSRDMDTLEDGEMSVHVVYDSSDELGHLVKSFRHMVSRIQYLIDEVYKSKITQQEYEMKALQAQINPHFLYNSLSLINGKAIMAEQEDISRMAQLLSTFYRTTLNKGKNLISVHDELENTKSYISIQNMMHSNSFDVVYDIDEAALSLVMINLLLQPLTENAIVHGIDHKETPGRGMLILSCKRTDSLLTFTVSDNGCGMKEETLSRLLTSETNGYGAYNVHQRIQLYYGAEYGLRYESKVNKGTTVWLTIPSFSSISAARQSL
ncbi:sensor histidine kinase [Anaerocolumna xylanovorans]|uniref:Two-component system, sensor histidine kinase YesM n=1 Tax=Anaerocolumna xylanovorans DSM 12503 TaxID=1121345 RepID=A0A1M7XZ79_9FIRM|nr:histidine kinase [Anaerocolumna xylanovorans]SHO44438.1 two-component system, sensor histidine kinase YesM [Anaerocolumna xylanovorans DSM 12503]